MSVNKAIIVGRIGKEPETRTVGETQVTNFTVATTDRAYKRTDGTEVEEKTEWHNIVAWRGLSKLMSYTTKGSQIYIEGKMTNRSYDDKDGIKRYISEIVATDIQLLDKKPVSDIQGSTTTSGTSFNNQKQDIPFDMGGDNNDDLPF